MARRKVADHKAGTSQGQADDGVGGHQTCQPPALRVR